MKDSAYNFSTTMKKIAIILIVLFIGFVLWKSKKSGHHFTSTTDNLKQFELVEAWKTDTLLMMPECVIYDNNRDVLYVSNQNNKSSFKGGNGFISRLSTSGEILDLEWVADMNSPKGLALRDEKLYVSDVDEVIVIDIESSEITERIHIEGSVMINDLAFDGDGNLYISDSGDNSIFLYSKGKVNKWIEGLNTPNGLLIDGDKLLLVSMGSEDLVSIDLASKEINIITEGVSRGDGVARIGIPSHYLVRNRLGEVFMVYPDGSKTSLLDTKGADIGSADIEFIPELDLLLIPILFSNHVMAYKLGEMESRSFFNFLLLKLFFMQ